MRSIVFLFIHRRFFTGSCAIIKRLIGTDIYVGHVSPSRPREASLVRQLHFDGLTPRRSRMGSGPRPPARRLCAEGSPVEARQLTRGHERQTPARRRLSRSQSKLWGEHCWSGGGRFARLRCAALVGQGPERVQSSETSMHSFWEVAPREESEWC